MAEVKDPPATENKTRVAPESFIDQEPSEPYMGCPPTGPYYQQVVDPMQTRGLAHYLQVDLLSWSIKDQPAPVLFTIGANAKVPFGGGLLDLDNGKLLGSRVTLGSWINPGQTLALEASVLYLEEQTSSFQAVSDGTPVISRPVTNVLNGLPFQVFVAQPGIQEGQITVETFSRLWGAEANLRKQLWSNCYFRLDALAGFRFLQLDESLAITEEIEFAAMPTIFSDARITTVDRFGTQNQLFCGQLGLASEFHYDRFFVNLWGKGAPGVNHQVVNIGGNTIVVGPSPLLGNQQVNGGVLALPSNSGRFSRSQVAIIAEAGANAGWQFHNRFRLSAGYSFLYITNVVRPGNQIDTNINPNFIPRLFRNPLGAARPTFAFGESDFWAQGINLELEFRF